MSGPYMYILYTLGLALALLISFPWWAAQALRLGKYRAGLKERLGFVPSRLAQPSGAGAIWIHAVSVGEVLAVSHLVRELQRTNPSVQVFISTTTATGQRLARERFGEDHVFFMPLDFGFALRAYLRRLRPRLLILAETEFWPNLLHLAQRHGAAVAIVNARVSDRSFPRYCRFRWFFRKVLADVDLFLAQTEADVQRLREIGASAERVQEGGNLKFDIRAASGSGAALAADLRRARGQDALTLVCGSTMEGEDELLLAAFRELQPRFPQVTMVLAPRHPERFDRVADLVAASGLTLVRRTAWTGGPVQGAVFLLDSVGELASVYGIADVAFVGGSLLPGAGGHNILEPAQHGVPILVGPNTYNFREIVSLFERAGAITAVNPGNLSGVLLRLLENGGERRRLGQSARELFLQNTGATARAVTVLQSLLPGPAN